MFGPVHNYLQFYTSRNDQFKAMNISYFYLKYDLLEFVHVHHRYSWSDCQICVRAEMVSIQSRWSAYSRKPKIFFSMKINELERKAITCAPVYKNLEERQNENIYRSNVLEKTCS